MICGGALSRSFIDLRIWARRSEVTVRRVGSDEGRRDDIREIAASSSLLLALTRRVLTVIQLADEAIPKLPGPIRYIPHRTTCPPNHWPIADSRHRRNSLCLQSAISHFLPLLTLIALDTATDTL